MTNQDGANGHSSRLQGIPEPPALTSERIKALLSKALTNTGELTQQEMREIAASVVFHLQALKGVAF